MRGLAQVSLEIDGQQLILAEIESGDFFGEIALLRADGFEVLPRDIFQPLTRAGIRLAGRNR